MQAFLVLALLAVVVVLLVTERLRPDLVAALTLALLIVLRVLPVGDALSGFSNPATITVACMFVLSAGLQASGLVRFLGDRVLRHGPSTEVGLLLLIALAIAPLSAVINNTAAVAVFLPVVLRVCQGAGVPPSRLLMPLAFSAILGGTCTLIGTSTNILVSSMAAARGVRPFGMFEITPLGLVYLGVGLVYLLLAGRHLLPLRAPEDELTHGYALQEFLSEVVVLPESPLVGQTVTEARLGERFDLEVLGVSRPGEPTRTPFDESLRLRADDLLLVKTSAANLVQLAPRTGLAVRPLRDGGAANLRSDETVLVEAVVYPNSTLDGRTLKGLDFRHRFGASVVALRRHGEDIVEKIGRVRLQGGDELLILVERRRLARLRQQPEFVVLQEHETLPFDPLRAATAALIVVGVVASAAAGLYPVVVSAFVGAVLMVVTGCLPHRRVYASIEWKVVILLGGIIPLSAALEYSGAADRLVQAILWVAGEYHPRVVLLLFTTVTYLLTGFMSNNATAALMVPLAISSAAELGVDSRPLLVAVMYAASAAFYTPVGYQTNLLVYGPGGYRFTDYTRVGGPLNLIYAGLSTLIIPLFFPFR